MMGENNGGRRNFGGDGEKGRKNERKCKRLGRADEIKKYEKTKQEIENEDKERGG